MNFSSVLLRLGALSLSSALLAAPSFAADKDASKDQLRRLQAAQQRLSQEKSVLTQQKAELETQLKAEGERAEAAQRAAAGRAASLHRELASLQEEKQKLAAQLAELAEARRKAEAEGVSLQAGLKRQEQATLACEAKNTLLYRYGSELLERYENGGILDGLARAEPFTQLKRVEIENVLDEYRDKLDGQKAAQSVPSKLSEKAR